MGFFKGLLIAPFLMGLAFFSANSALADGNTRLTGVFVKITTPKASALVYCGITVRETMNNVDDKAGSGAQKGCMDGIQKGLLNKGITLVPQQSGVYGLSKNGQVIGTAGVLYQKYNRTNLTFGNPLGANGNPAFPMLGAPGYVGDIALNAFDMRGAPAGSQPNAQTPKVNLTGNRHGDVVMAMMQGNTGYSALVQTVSLPDNLFQALF